MSSLILWPPKVRESVHKKQMLDPILSQSILVHTGQPNLLKTRFDIVFPSAGRCR